MRVCDYRLYMGPRRRGIVEQRRSPQRPLHAAAAAAAAADAPLRDGVHSRGGLPGEKGRPRPRLRHRRGVGKRQHDVLASVARETSNHTTTI